MQFVFIVCLSQWLAIYIKITRMTTCLHFIQSFFKNKRGRELVSLPHFLQDLWRKIVLTLYSDQILTNQISLSDYFSWDNGQYMCCHYFSPRWRRHNFWNSPQLWYQDKNLNILRRKRAPEMELTTFFIILKGLSMNRIKPSFLIDESPALNAQNC